MVTDSFSGENVANQSFKVRSEKNDNFSILSHTENSNIQNDIIDTISIITIEEDLENNVNACLRLTNEGN